MVLYFTTFLHRSIIKGPLQRLALSDRYRRLFLQQAPSTPGQLQRISHIPGTRHCATLEFLRCTCCDINYRARLYTARESWYALTTLTQKNTRCCSSPSRFQHRVTEPRHAGSVASLDRSHVPRKAVCCSCDFSQVCIRRKARWLGLIQDETVDSVTPP